MQPRTAYRLAMLRNGYVPVLTDCKRSIEPGWPRKRVDEAEVLSWDRSACLSTGLRLDGDLAVIDVDASEPALVEELACTLARIYPQLFARGLVRHAGGVKEAWIVRTEEPFRRLASRRWYRGSDPDDPAVPKHMVECFGSRATRQFGVDGPHARDRQGEVISTYRFTAGASPASVPRASLPALPKASFGQACDLFDGIAATAGLQPVPSTASGESTARMVYDLTDTMVFESESGRYRLGELDDARAAANHQGFAFRVSSSFLGHGSNPTKCLVGFSHRRRCVCIHDCETGITHLPASRKPIEDSLITDILGRMSARTHPGKGAP